MISLIDPLRLQILLIYQYSSTTLLHSLPNQLTNKLMSRRILKTLNSRKPSKIVKSKRTKIANTSSRKVAGSALAATTTTLRDARNANGARSQRRSWTRLAYPSTSTLTLRTKLPWRNRKLNKRDSKRYRILERRRHCWPSRNSLPKSTPSWSNCL